jgi:hypothetical protein
LRGIVEVAATEAAAAENKGEKRVGLCCCCTCGCASVGRSVGQGSIEEEGGEGVFRSCDGSCAAVCLLSDGVD